MSPEGGMPIPQRMGDHAGKTAVSSCCQIIAVSVIPRCGSTLLADPKMGIAHAYQAEGNAEQPRGAADDPARCRDGDPLHPATEGAATSAASGTPRGPIGTPRGPPPHTQRR